jgi:hypothetical protein
MKASRMWGREVFQDELLNERILNRSYDDRLLFVF